MFTRLVFILFFGFFQLATSQAAAPILTIYTSIDVSRKDAPFGVPKTIIKKFWPRFHQKRKFLVDFRRDRNFRLKMGFNRTSSV